MFKKDKFGKPFTGFHEDDVKDEHEAMAKAADMGVKAEGFTKKGNAWRPIDAHVQPVNEKLQTRTSEDESLNDE
jgi:hypothetical protein